MVGFWVRVDAGCLESSSETGCRNFCSMEQLGGTGDEDWANVVGEAAQTGLEYVVMSKYAPA